MSEYKQTVNKIYRLLNILIITLMKQNLSGGLLRIYSERCQTWNHIDENNKNKGELTMTRKLVCIDSIPLRTRPPYLAGYQVCPEIPYFITTIGLMFILKYCQ